jgi:signal transduction protein with GAF and PtsI domain
MKQKNKINQKKSRSKKEQKEIIKQIIDLIATGNSMTDIIVNSSELIIKEFSCSYYIIYLLDGNKLKCFIKRNFLSDIEFPQEIIFDSDLNEILKIKEPFLNKNNKYEFLLKKLNIKKYTYYIISPVINLGELVGFMIIGREKKPFNPGDEKLFFSIASLLAASFLNTKKISKNQDIQKQIEALMKISKTIVEKNSLEEILKIIVNIVADVMDYKICSVMLSNEEKQELEIKATQALSDEYRLKPNLKIGQSLSGKAIKEKKPVSSIDVVKDPDYKYPEIAKKQGLKSMLAVPMIVKNKAIGVINVYTTTEHIFGEEEIKMLSAVANLAAVAIENSKLEEETLKVKDALETRKLIERAKGILMKLNNMTEEEAYTTMRKKAMDMCKPLKEIAEAIILTMEMNKKNPGGKDVSSK